MYGLETPSEGGEKLPAKKPTTFMTNAACVAERLRRKCDNRHRHQALMGGRAKKAAEYPEELCE